MSKRSYGYYDPLAQALDAAGERWALLIVRELMSGAVRFGDIADRLPGLGTARLTDRLREMENAGLIEGGNGYRLTESGAALAPSVCALTRFGLRGLKPLQGTATVYRPSFGAFALRALADGVRWHGEPFRSITVVENQAFVTEAGQRGVATRHSDVPAIHTREPTVQLDTILALALATGARTVKASFADGRLTSNTNARVLRLWAKAHGLTY